MRAEDVIRKPLILTEKGTRMRTDENKYSFEVHPKASKEDVKDAVETLFKVDVEAVNTMIVRGKTKRRLRRLVKLTNWKKAIVSVKAGETIDLFEGA